MPFKYYGGVPPNYEKTAAKSPVRTIAPPKEVVLPMIQHIGAPNQPTVKVGDTVEKNQTLVTIEAMKMETAITARMSGTVSEILVKEGETVKGGQLILVIK